MNRIVQKVEVSGYTGTVWFALITIAASVLTQPEFYRLVPQEALPYLVIALGLLQGLKRFLSGGIDNLTVWLSAIQVFLGVLAMPQWGQLLDPQGLAVLASVNAAITWWKRIFFPTAELTPSLPGPTTGPTDLYLDENGKPVKTIQLNPYSAYYEATDKPVEVVRGRKE